MFSEDAERRATYERIQRQDKNHCATAIRRAGLALVRWEQFGTSPGEDRVEEEIVSGRDMSRDEVLGFLTRNLFPEQTFVDHLSDRRESLYGKTVRMVERDYQQVLGYPIPATDMAVRAIKRMCNESRIGLRHSRENICGRTPSLTSTELREATIDAPFVEGEAPRPRPLGPVEVLPIPGGPGPVEPGEIQPSVPSAQIQDIRCLPKDSAGDLRIEVATRLAALNEARVRQIIFKIFYQQVAGDLSTLPVSLRGGLSGSGSVTAEIQIVKQGDFSKAEVEQMVEALPPLAGAKYDAQLRVEVPLGTPSHVQNR